MSKLSGAAAEVPWTLPPRWRERLLRDVAAGGRLQTGPFGSDLHASDYSATGVPVVMPQDLRDGRIDLASIARVAPEHVARLARYELAPGDIVLSRRGDVTRRALVTPNEKGWLCGTGCLLIRLPQGDVTPAFLYHYLAHPDIRDWLRRHSIGATMANLNTEILGRLPIAVPSPDEQRRIDEVLSSLDHKIELNRQMNATLEALARVVFEQRVVAPARDGLPVGWTRAALGEHLDVTRGLSYSGAGLVKGGGVPLHNLDSVREGGGYKRSGIKRYTGEYRERHVIRPGEVIVANTEQGHEELLIGCPAIVPRAFGEIGLFSQDLSRVVPKQGSSLTPRFIYLLLANERIRRTVAAFANGTTVNHLPREALERPTFPLPPARVITEADALVVPLLERIEANEDENATLTELRDVMLPGLVSGTVRVR